ncbi:MAG TPA: ATP-binding protein [Anaerolineales bacterium]|nr:ATP-binding protein [Anaerolineales bacterium]
MTSNRPSASRRFTPLLFLLVVLPLTVLLVVIAFGSLRLHSQAMRSLVAEREARTVHAATDAIAEQLRHRGASVQALAIHAEGRSPSEALSDFAFLLPDFEGGLALAAADGTILDSIGETEVWQSLSIDALVSQALAGSGVHYSPTLEVPVLQGRVVMAAAAGPDGLIALGAFMPGNLASRVLDDTFPEASQVHAWLVDPEARPLYRLGSGAETPALADRPGVAQALRGESGVTFAVFEGEEHVIAYRPVPPLGWGLVIEEPWEVVDNPLLRQTQAAPLILLPALFFALLALAFGVRQVVQPLQALEARAASLGAGDFEAIERPVGGIGEIRSLQATLTLMAQRLKLYQDSIRRYAAAVTRGQEDERRRLARELHDDTVQALIALDQRTQMAQMAVRKGEVDAGQRLAELRQWTIALLDGVRRVIRALRPIYLEDLGLPAALEMLAQDVEKASGLKVHLETRGQPVRLAPEREIAVYRIAQEALSNVARHAQARVAHLQVTFDPDRLILMVHDEGVGFEAPERLDELASSNHYGLLGMQERAELMGAHLSLKSSPGSGTTVRLELPV